MTVSRRVFIKKMLSLGMVAVALRSDIVYASLDNIRRIKDNFNPEPYQKILARVFNQTRFINSRKIAFSRLPRVAENGAVVPITVSSSIENISKISILVENNPHPLIAEFYLSPYVSAHVSARIKMAKTSKVIAIVEADGKFYRKAKKVKVVKGGCG